MLRSWGSSDGHGKEEDSALGAVADEGLYSRRVSTFQDAKRNQSGLVDAGRCFLTNSGSVKAHCLPSLVCIGAMKAGTFELKQWLEEHPLVAAASHEQHFFGHGDNAGYTAWRGYALSNQEWALSRSQIAKGTITFEKTPYYLASTVAALEMHSLLPNLRVVALLRDPAARAYSSFYHHCSRNQRLVVDAKRRVVFNGDCATVEHCCCSPHDVKPKGRLARKRVAANQRQRAGRTAGAATSGRGVAGFVAGLVPSWRSAGSGKSGVSSAAGRAAADAGFTLAHCDAESFDNYLASTERDAASPGLGTVLRKGLYGSQLGTYVRLFGQANVLAMDFKTFARDPAAATNRVYAFAGLTPYEFGPDRAAKNEQGFWYLKGKESKSNKQKPYPPMLPSSKTMLGAFYKAPDAQLRALFPDEPFTWMDAVPSVDAAADLAADAAADASA